MILVTDTTTPELSPAQTLAHVSALKVAAANVALVLGTIAVYLFL